jgi:hypothetical protein
MARMFDLLLIRRYPLSSLGGPISSFSFFRSRRLVVVIIEAYANLNLAPGVNGKRKKKKEKKKEEKRTW